MSLFGESPPRQAKPTKSGLFDDEQPARKAGSGLFADDTESSAASPWDFPSPKKAARRNVVKTLLEGADVPDVYVDAFDNVLASGDGSSGTVSLDEAKRLLAGSGIGAAEQAKILEIVQGGSDGLGRSEFNVLLALIGLAQEGDELSLDAVDERKERLPVPSLPTFATAARPPHQAAAAADPSSASPPKTRNMRKQSFGFGESDPWSAPALHKGHDHAAQNGSGPYTNGTEGSSTTAPTRTTSSFTTSAAEPPSEAPSSTAYESTEQTSAGGEGAGWGAYGAQGDTFANPGPGGDDGFGAPSSNGGNGSGARPIARAHKSTGAGVEEVVTVNALDEKEGVFLFQHRNYEISSMRRNSKVIRRYSDFVWLLDCLHKRYPFRQLPLLPPKRVAINGNHIAADTLFIEKRRRGLARFTNALVRHPVLSQEQLVIMFLTVPTELSVWRKQATISVQEEFGGKSLPPGLEDSLPSTLPELFETVRSGVRRSAEIYINLCTMVEKLTKYNNGLAVEYMRLSLALESATEASEDTYAIDTNDVPLLNEGIKSTAKHLSTNQSLLEDEARAWDLGVLEDLKRQRDCLVSVRDMFDRRDRYAKDNIPQLERRIASNENKLAGIRAKPEGQGKPGEAEKVEDAITKDKKSIVDQHARGVFIKECVRDEILYFNTSQYHISSLHQDWSQERVKYAELGADNWRALGEEVEGMPLGD